MPRRPRRAPRVCYTELEEPDFDEYVFCEECADFVYEYCSIHGPLLVVPDDKVAAKPNFPSLVPRAALTIPHVFLHLAPSIIPGAGIGVFSTLTLPRGVRFGPYRGQRTNEVHSMYCWQIYDRNNKPSHAVDAADCDKSNWMRYVNCARHWREQNLLAYQYHGQLYYRTIKIIPRFTELMVFYGSVFANALHVDLRRYNSPPGYAQKYGVPPVKKPKLEESKISEIVTAHNIPQVKENLETHIQVEEFKLVTPRNREASTNDFAKLVTECKDPTSCNVIDADTKNIIIESDTIVYYDCDKIFDPKNVSCENRSLITSNVKLIKNKIKDNLTNEQPYACHLCEYRCKNGDNLKTHIRTHTDEKRYASHLCDYKCNNSGDLKKHIRTHTREKPYACHFCDYKCNRSGNLKKHIRTHTGEKPYACHLCDYKCKSSGALKTHIRTHTGEKPYACHLCDYKFNNSSNLKKHIRTHTGEKPYACHLCDYKCKSSGALKTHIRTHTGEKPYACHLCDYKFNNSGNLKKHIRTHTGEKPYACHLCDYKCNQNCNLKTHIIRTHTGQNPAINLNIKQLI